MGLFGRNDAAAEPLDPRLEAQVPDASKELRKILRKEAPGIAAVLGQDEKVRFLCNSESAYATSVDMFAAIVVTDRRLLIARKGRVQEFPLDECRGAQYGTDTGCYQQLVSVGFRTGDVRIHMKDVPRMYALFAALGVEPSF